MKKNLQCALAASAFMLLVNSGHGAPATAHSTTTPIIHLDGEGWRIATDPGNQGREQKWFEAPRPEAKPIAVPSTIQEAFPNYHGLAWYWKSFDAPVNPDPQGRYLLRFWSVDYKADVWVNGVQVGSHEDAEEPFVLDVTDAVRAGTGNLLAVRVLNPNNTPIDGLTLGQTARGAKVLPQWPGMEWNFGGILDSVELLTAPAVRIDDLHLVPNWQTGEIEVSATLRNAGKQPGKVRLGLEVAPATGGENADETTLEVTAPVGESVIKGKLGVPRHRLWTLDDPFLYRVSARLQVHGSPAADEQAVRCGFRDFDFTNGYFRLNGHRVFLKSAHSLWTTPIKLHAGDDLPMIRRDIIYAKTMGFNMIRFLPFAASRAHLDLCDELGVMVMQQSASSWAMGNSPQMQERFDRSLLGVVRRDRNHPSIALWYFLNETNDGPVFRHAIEALPKVRELDASRLCLLNSGRFDKDKSIGSLSRPGSPTWDHIQLEDAHHYKNMPHLPTVIDFLRKGIGDRQTPALLSEYGIATAMDLVTLTRYYERLGATDKMDARYYRSKLDQFMVDWNRWKLAEIFGRPEDYFKAALSTNASQRKLGMNAIRANPNMVGYSMTALHDEVSCGEGPITFLRDLKPGVVDAIRTGFAPLKWNLFVEPWNLYRGGTVHAEVVLANEDALRPGDYSVEVALMDPEQKPVLKETVPLHIPDSKTELPFALPVWAKDVKIDGIAGRYRLTANFVSGASAVDDEAEFLVTDAKQMPPVATTVSLCGKDSGMEAWFKDKGIGCRPFDPATTTPHETILVCGQINPVSLQSLAKSIAGGASAVFLTPLVQPISDSPDLLANWTVFEAFAPSVADPATPLLTSIPPVLKVGGQTGTRHEIAADAKGLLDLAPWLWAGKKSDQTAYVYVPFSCKKRGNYTLWLGVGGQFKAWVDGKPFCQPLAGEWLTPQRHAASADLEAGDHLLVMKYTCNKNIPACAVNVSVPALYGEAPGANLEAKEPVTQLQWLPLKAKGTVCVLDECLYRRDDWSRRHPVFDGLPCGGLMDWTLYRNIVPQNGVGLTAIDTPDEVVCGALRTSEGYASGLYVGVYRMGAGTAILNCLNIRGNLGKDPVAERLLRNLLNYAATPAMK